MCGRYVLAGDPESYAEIFRVDRIAAEPLTPSFNVAPTDPVYAIAEWEEERLLETMSWGFTPHWAKDRKTMQINARAETVATSSMFRDSLSRKRCLIPADGFYEWGPGKTGRTPHWIYRADGFPMAFAGIYSSWRPPGKDERIRTCAILTTEATGPVGAIHHRMPVSLDPELWGDWLDRHLTDPDLVARLIRPGTAEILGHIVSTAVNSVRNNSPHLAEPSSETLF